MKYIDKNGNNVYLPLTLCYFKLDLIKGIRSQEVRKGFIDKFLAKKLPNLPSEITLKEVELKFVSADTNNFKPERCQISLECLIFIHANVNTQCDDIKKLFE